MKLYELRYTQEELEAMRAGVVDDLKHIMAELDCKAAEAELAAITRALAAEERTHSNCAYYGGGDNCEAFQRIVNSLQQAKCGGHPVVSCTIYTEHVQWLLTELQAARRMLELYEMREQLRDQKT